MTIDPNQPDLTIGIVGSGAMGRGIAQLAALSDCRVILHDSRADAVSEAIAFITSMISRAVEKGRTNEAEATKAISNLQAASTLAELADCQVVIEAIVEDLDIKQKLFAELEQVTESSTLLATNTSSLLIDDISEACAHPARVAGMHFFNPVPLMKLVEVIAAPKTDERHIETLLNLAARFGHKAVRVADAPGFLVNQVGRGYAVEAAHIIENGVASFVDADRLMRDRLGFRMGPFELTDLTGLDVTHPATVAIYEGHNQAARFRPAPLMADRLTKGLLGKKSGAGFYDYEDGKPQIPDEPAAPTYDGRPVWTDGESPALQSLLASLDAPHETGPMPSDEALILLAPMGQRAADMAADLGFDPARSVAVETLFAMDKRRSLMTTPRTSEVYRNAAWGLMASDGTPVTVIQDTPGFFEQRIVAMIINIACGVVEDGVAAPADIDTAVQIALGYPFGPMAFGDDLGTGRIIEILENIRAATDDERYQSTERLRQCTLLGLSLLETGPA